MELLSRVLDAFEFWANSHAGWALALILVALLGVLILDARWQVGG